MEQLYVRKELFPLSEDGPTYLRATDDEVLAAAATLDGAKVLQAEITPAGCIEDYWNLDVDDLERARWAVSEPGHPSRYLVIPLPDKETTDE